MVDHRANRLLASLDPEDFSRLEPHLEHVELPRGRILAQQGEMLRQTYFPLTAVVSLVRDMSDGRAAEMATFGCEGLVGLLFYGTPLQSFGRYLVQLPGAALRIDSDRMQKAADARSGIRDMVSRYTEMLTALTLQAVACNAAHGVEARACRWIVATHDRVDRDDLPLTHEFLAEMLGVQRSTVTAVTRTLQDEGLIRQERGVITVLDRPRLQQAACECYGVLRGKYLQLFPATKTMSVR